jgi:hypothetical protein
MELTLRCQGDDGSRIFNLSLICKKAWALGESYKVKIHPKFDDVICGSHQSYLLLSFSFFSKKTNVDITIETLELLSVVLIYWAIWWILFFEDVRNLNWYADSW